MAVEGWHSLAGSRISRAEAIAHELELEITGGRRRPGDRLGTKDDLRQRFSVAVATINEAIRLLEMRRYLEARPGPGGGIFVAASSTRVRAGNLELVSAIALGDEVALEAATRRHLALSSRTVWGR